MFSQFCSPGHDARTIARAAEKVEDVGYVRALQASEHRMMTSIEEVNLRFNHQVQVHRQESEDFYTQLHDAQADRRDIRLEIDVVRGQRTTYETELHKRQSTQDLAVRQMIRIHVLEARAQIDTVEDTGSSCAAKFRWRTQKACTTCHDAAYSMTWGTLKKKLTDKYCPKGEIKKLKIELWNLKVRGNDAATYTQQLADGKIIEVNTIIRSCTLNFINHPFNIDLMPVPLGSFDVILGKDWLTKYHGVIICNEKIVRVPFRRETLIFQDDGNNQREESRLNIILCTKAQKYLSKGCDAFLAHITMNEAKDKSEGTRLEDVPIVRDFPEVFPKDLSGIPPARQVEFQIDLVPGAAPVARAPYWLEPSEMKELAEQLQELSDKGFIRLNSSPWGAPVLFFKKKDGPF
nr:putative reverse transcriptase domain-containing protein [Tanacetum cinerariifolium]